MKECTDLEVLAMCLKSGEYDGTNIMQAWIAIERLIELEDLSLRAELDAANANIAELTGKLSSHEKLCIAGIYYTEEELDISKKHWEKMAIAKAKSGIQANAIHNLISEKSVSANVDGCATSVIYVCDAEDYANKLKASK